jgi:triosephosphate isomerase
MERHDGETNDVIHDQLVAGLANVTSEDMKHIVIAYEPVWAIGTGDNAKPYDVEKAVEMIRRQVRHLFGAQTAKEVPVLYGGSVSKDNATSYLNSAGVNGLLIGNACLSVEQFSAIIKQAYESQSSKR